MVLYRVRCKIVIKYRRQIFKYINQSEDEHFVTCSMLEIYREKLKDLFACEKNELKIK
jgi:hypothetical protein